MAKEKQKTAITLPPINIKRARITLVGTSPLLMHRFSEKVKSDIAAKQGQKAVQKRAARDPMAEMRSALYVLPGKKNAYGIPGGALKNTAVSATRYVQYIKRGTAQGAFHVLAGPNNLVPLTGSKPVLDTQPGRIGPFGAKIGTLIYRPRFDKWSVAFDVEYNANVISVEQLLNLYENAGFSVGLCDFRPEKSGPFGRFQVKRA